MTISKKLLALMCALGLSVASLAGCESNNAGAGGSGDGGNSGSNSGGANSNTSEYDIEEIHYDKETGEPFTCVVNYHKYVVDIGFESSLTADDPKVKTDDYMKAHDCVHHNTKAVSYDIAESVDDITYLRVWHSSA